MAQIGDYLKLHNGDVVIVVGNYTIPVECAGRRMDIKSTEVSECIPPTMSSLPPQPNREDVHEQVADLYARFRDSLPAAAFAEFLLIALHRSGALAFGMKPDVGPRGGESWPKREG